MRREVSMEVQNRMEHLPTTGKLACIAALMLVVFLVFGQTYNYDFVNYDDTQYVTDNAVVKSGITLHNIVWAFTATSAANWHPLTWLSHMLDVQLFGLNAAGHHMTNVLFHLINTLLVFLVLRTTTGCWWRSLFVAALFGLHPLHVESVAWIAERKDVLSTLFWLLTMYVYSRYVATRTLGAYFLALGFFALGLMSKPMLVTLPFVLLLWDIWPLDRCTERYSRLLLEKVPFLVLTVVSCIITYYAQLHGGSVSVTIPLQFRAINAMVSYWRYMADMFWPASLAVIYPLPTNVYLLQGILAAAGLLVISFICIRLRHGRPFLPVGWFWYLGTLVPVIGLVQVGEQSRADRYTYIPLLGLFILIAWGVPPLLKRLRIPAAPLAVIVLAGLSACTFFQVRHWKNNFALFSHAARVVPDNHVAHLNVGSMLADQGRFPEAIGHYLASLKTQPGSSEVHGNLGKAYAESGDFTKALIHYGEALRLEPENADILFSQGMALAIQGKLDAAIDSFKKSLLVRPTSAETHYNLGVALIKTGHREDAVSHFTEALRINPKLDAAKRALDKSRTARE